MNTAITLLITSWRTGDAVVDGPLSPSQVLIVLNLDGGYMSIGFINYYAFNFVFIHFVLSIFSVYVNYFTIMCVCVCVYWHMSLHMCTT